MQIPATHAPRAGWFLPGAALLLTLGLLTAAGCGSSDNGSDGLPGSRATLDQVTRGRYLVTTTGCTDCHNRGVDDPADANWLAGAFNPGPGRFQIPTPSGVKNTYAANLTPDTTNGIGMHTDRQIYNALKYGLDPEETPDVVITSTTPGQGNYPATPHYLAAPMPWTATRHLSDTDLWAIVAYLKHGIKAVNQAVPPSEDTADHWAFRLTQEGPYPLPAYPAASEQFTP